MPGELRGTPVRDHDSAWRMNRVAPTERVHWLVEGSVEFAKAGTDPKPEDALKNVYA